MGTYSFSLVPSLNSPEIIVWARGQLKSELEAKQSVYMLHEVKQRADFLFELMMIPESAC